MKLTKVLHCLTYSVCRHAFRPKYPVLIGVRPFATRSKGELTAKATVVTPIIIHLLYLGVRLEMILCVDLDTAMLPKSFFALLGPCSSLLVY